MSSSAGCGQPPAHLAPWWPAQAVTMPPAGPTLPRQGAQGLDSHRCCFMKTPGAERSGARPRSQS